MIIDSDLVKKLSHRQSYHWESCITLAKLLIRKNLKNSFSWGRNYKMAKCGDFLHFPKHSPLCNWIWKRTMFFVFSFFHFLCKLIISTSTLSVDKKEICRNFQKFFFSSLTHISGYPPKENQNTHFFWLCHLSSGTCGLLKKTKNKKILLKFFHLFHLFGKKRYF